MSLHRNSTGLFTMYWEMHLSVELQLSLQMTWVAVYFVSQGKSLRLRNKGQQNLRYVLIKTPAAYIWRSSSTLFRVHIFLVFTSKILKKELRVNGLFHWKVYIFGQRWTEILFIHYKHGNINEENGH